MDATGLNALEDLHDRLKRKGKHLVLSGPHVQPLFVMEKPASSIGSDAPTRTWTPRSFAGGGNHWKD